jgi:hypothetical protein
MATGPIQNKANGPDLKSLGFNSPTEIIDILASLKVDNHLVCPPEAFGDPQQKAMQVVKFFADNFDMKPNELPHLASVVKKELQAGRPLV